MLNITSAAPVQKISDEEKFSVKKISDEDKNFFSKNKKRQDEIFDDEIKKKLQKVILSKEALKFINNEISSDNKLKKYLLRILNSAVSSHFKKELLDIAKSVLSVSLEDHPSEFFDEEDEKELANLLAKYVLKLSNKYSSKKALHLKKPNANEDKNAGFLVHYCKEILNSKSEIASKPKKLKRITPEEIEKLLKK